MLRIASCLGESPGGTVGKGRFANAKGAADVFRVRVLDHGRVVGGFDRVGVFFTSSFAAGAQAAFDFTTANLYWFYMISTTLFLGFIIWLAFSRYGKIRLGKEGEEPEFDRFSWVAMLFQAGMGLALVFWGVSEPITHYSDPPFHEAEPNTTAAAQLAM
jgi:glycine betaine transporter